MLLPLLSTKHTPSVEPIMYIGHMYTCMEADMGIVHPAEHLQIAYLSS